MNKLMTRDYFPAWLAIFFLFIVLLLMERGVLAHTNGVFCYPLDDTFIHIAVARNVAFHGNWGVAAHGFQSASSSVLYTLLLAGLFKLFTVHVMVPFVLNVVVAVILLLVLQEWLLRQGLSRRAQFTAQAAVVLLTPLPVLVMMGMEHTLQCLFCFLFLTRASEWLVSERRITPALLLYGVLVTGIRYEGVFLVFIICVMSLLRRRVAVAFLLGGVSLLPIILFGLYSLGKGSYFFPNSVLLKSDGAQTSAVGLGSVRGLLEYLYFRLLPRVTTSGLENYAAAATQHLLVIIPLAGWVFWAPLRRLPAYGVMLRTLFFCTVLQLAFASTGWFYRYEAYLIFCTTAVLSMLALQFGREVWRGEELRRSWVIPACLIAVLCLPLVIRCGSAFGLAQRACRNIYEQQYQTAQFVHKWYPKDGFAVNDIGAVSFFSDGENIDLEGLGNYDVARRRMAGKRTAGFLDSLLREKHVDYAAVYPFWYGDSLVGRWQKVASWTIQHNVVCGDPTVYFYAIDSAKEAEFRKNLKAQETVLPPGVTVRYY